jgi:hypothetical protein
MDKGTQKIIAISILILSISIGYFLIVRLPNQNLRNILLQYDYTRLAANTYDLFLADTCGGSSEIIKEECASKMFDRGRFFYLAYLHLTHPTVEVE